MITASVCTRSRDSWPVDGYVSHMVGDRRHKCESSFVCRNPQRSSLDCILWWWNWDGEAPLLMVITRPDTNMTKQNQDSRSSRSHSIVYWIGCLGRAGAEVARGLGHQDCAIFTSRNTKAKAANVSPITLSIYEMDSFPCFVLRASCNSSH